MPASGVLVVGVGSGTKALQQALSGVKKYEAVVKMGTETDTNDAYALIHITFKLSRAHIFYRLHIYNTILKGGKSG